MTGYARRVPAVFPSPNPQHIVTAHDAPEWQAAMEALILVAEGDRKAVTILGQSILSSLRNRAGKGVEQLGSFWGQMVIE